MTEMSEYFHTGEGTEGHHSRTSRNCVCSSSKRNLAKNGLCSQTIGGCPVLLVLLFLFVCLLFLDDRACVLLICDFRFSFHSAFLYLLRCFCGHCIWSSTPFMSWNNTNPHYCIDLLAVIRPMAGWAFQDCPPGSWGDGVPWVLWLLTCSWCIFYNPGQFTSFWLPESAISEFSAVWEI